MAGERLFICSPSFTGSYCSQYIESLVGTIKDCQQHGIKTLYKTLDGVHWIDIARDILAHVFLHSDCTHMIQIDSDLGWSPDAPRRMVQRNLAIVGGVYPFRADIPAFPFKSGETGVSGLPGGFLMVRRDVVENLSEGLQKYACASLQFGALQVAPLFTREFRSDGYTGEDYAFCKRATDAGYSLSTEPDIDFTHVGQKAWAGNYGKQA